MSYYVHKTTNNGYYCGCCSHSSTDTEKFHTLAEALAEVPKITETFSGHGDWVLEKVVVEDGTDGEELAEWHMCPIKMGKVIHYWSVSRYVPDEPYQSVVYDSGGRRTTIDYKEAYAIVEKERLERELQDKQQKLEEAQKNFNWAKKQLEENRKVNELSHENVHDNSNT